jgi:hypothetical protein
MVEPETAVPGQAAQARGQASERRDTGASCTYRCGVQLRVRHRGSWHRSVALSQPRVGKKPCPCSEAGLSCVVHAAAHGMRKPNELDVAFRLQCLLCIPVQQDQN